jgi:transcription-repair coupling factor (superfamily II helicase)
LSNRTSKPHSANSAPIPLPQLLQEEAFPALAGLAFRKQDPLYVAGLAGSAVSALLARQFLDAKGQGNLLYLAPDAKTAEMVAEDLESWIGEDQVLQFPGLDLKPYEWRKPFGHVLEQRLACFEALYKKKRSVLVTTLPTFLTRLSSPDSLHLEILNLAKGQSLNLEDFRDAVLHMGFTEESVVQDIGEFSVRGEIIDIYPYLLENPVRIVLFGDEIESVKEFDIFTQRSVKDIPSVDVFPLDECCFSHKDLEAGMEKHFNRFIGEGSFEAENHRLLVKRDLEGIHWQKAFFKDLNYSLLDFLGPQARVVVGDEDHLKTGVERLWAAAEEGYQEAIAKEKWVARPDELFFSKDDLDGILAGRETLRLGRLSWEGPGCRTLDMQEQARGGGGLAQVEHVLRELEADGIRVYLLSPNEGQAERLRKLTAEFGIAGVAVGHLASGFISRDDGVAVFTDHQIFNRFSRKIKRKKQKGGGVSIQNFEALARGDYVVHEDYGIARFVGVKRIKTKPPSSGAIDAPTPPEIQVDCILLDFQGSDKLALPVTDLSKLEKYSSEEGHVPVLSKLGGKTWDNQKEKAKKSIVKLAQDLIELYAKRSVMQGYAFSKDQPLQKEFEEAFEFDLTPDQAKAVADEKGDMERPKPMDRLICGDVGFGKTEVAMRAAFKAVLDKKQVCVLAPTTILAAQHYASFTDRFGNWPVRIDYLNRFKGPKEQKETIAALGRGEVDLIIGTHRLIGKDVIFKDLGLMIIDEEQKFGVKQKERLKEMRTHVDVLSMSATPIPRTLNMSLVGARDLSIIATPPRNRLPIDTRVIFHDPKAIRDAIEMELARGGQAFYVHNRVMDLPEVTTFVEGLVPHARVGMAHGQMDEVALEQVMAAFVNREYDVLVATGIIESGLDIPNANTIIINRADLFGLSQLYQLRGRVGRSATKAYCFLISPDANKFSDDAKKRLYSLEKFTDLGSGFQIAMRDLEIRGAGNILGLEQSGHIAAVGFETYHRMLREAVKEMQGARVIPPLNSEIEFPEDAFIPEEYVEDGLQRVALYQKLARCTEVSQIDEVGRELLDRFGQMPPSVQVLLDSMVARVAAQTLGFQKVALNGNLLNLQYAEMHVPEKEELGELVKKFRRPMRFLYTKPLQMLVELNPPRSGDTHATIAQSAQILRDLLATG